jgi:DNA-binding MarR family transcriptional regulator
MEFRVALKILNEIGSANSEEFAKFCMEKYGYVRMPIDNARTYLYRLYKMGLAKRVYDRSSGFKKCYRYELTKKGRNYLGWLYKVKVFNDFTKRFDPIPSRRDCKKMRKNRFCPYQCVHRPCWEV